MAEPTVKQRLLSHGGKLTLIGSGAVFASVGLVSNQPLVAWLGLVGGCLGSGLLLNYWGEHTDIECHVCGQPTGNALVTCDECQDIVPTKAYVLECEWCEKTWYSDFRLWNTARSTLHAYREHPDELEEDYG